MKKYWIQFIKVKHKIYVVSYVNTDGRKLTFCSIAENLGLAVEIKFESCFYRISEFHSMM